ncbi:MAG: NADP-binding protein, partial [candidate division NC10 bacterium]
DAVYITGTPNLEVVIRGGTPGDVATAAMVVNAAHRVVDAPPGLATMKDLPLVICAAGRI